MEQMWQVPELVPLIVFYSNIRFPLGPYLQPVGAQFSAILQSPLLHLIAGSFLS